MAKAVQCDRCKRFAAIVTDIPLAGWKYLTYDIVRDEHGSVICPECLGEFERFMAGAHVGVVQVEKAS